MTDPTKSSDKNYNNFLEAVKLKIHEARFNFAKAACKEQLNLYWWFGQQIVDNQSTYGWGNNIVETLSKDLKSEFPDSKFGFSPRNLWDMRRFYMEYNDYPKLRQLVAEIPWGHNLIIMSRVKNMDAREYYLQSTRDMIWTRDTLLLQINNQLYEHKVLIKKQHNFEKTLPADYAKMADMTFKDIYTFEMLGLTKPVVEAEMESRMVAKIKDVILELGYGFSFIGNQYRLVSPSGKETFIDLLLYNRRLRALVALEIKSGAFQPEYAGRMNYQLNLLDDLIKEPEENPSIGIILCSERNKIDVEYAFRGLDKPIGVSEYKLAKTLPKELADKLPNLKELELQIKRELGENGQTRSQTNKIPDQKM